MRPELPTFFEGLRQHRADLAGYFSEFQRLYETKSVFFGFLRRNSRANSILQVMVSIVAAYSGVCLLAKHTPRKIVG